MGHVGTIFGLDVGSDKQRTSLDLVLSGQVSLQMVLELVTKVFSDEDWLCYMLVLDLDVTVHELVGF